jgi:hypothetical protein
MTTSFRSVQYVLVVDTFGTLAGFSGVPRMFNLSLGCMAVR